MYDHDNKRPRGFGFITFAEDESVDKVFSHGAMQNIHDKQIEIKPAVPRDQMPPQARRGPPFFPVGRGAGALGPAGMAGFVPQGRAPPFGFRQALPAPGAFGPGPRTPGGMPYLQGVPSPRGLPANIAPGYGGSPHARGAAAPYAPAAMQAPLQYGQQQQQQQRFSAAGMGSGGGRFSGMGQQQFGTGMYGSLGFTGGDAGGLIQQGTSPGGMGMYSIGGPLQQLQPTQQQLQTAQQQGSLNGYPGQLDMSKLAPLTAGANPQGAAAAAAAAAMAAKGYAVQPGLATGGFPGFAGGQQAFAAQAEPAYAGGDPAAAAAAAAAAGYGAEAVAHMQGTSPLGTTPEFATFGAGAAAPWGS